MTLTSLTYFEGMTMTNKNSQLRLFIKTVKSQTLSLAQTIGSLHLPTKLEGLRFERVISRWALLRRIRSFSKLGFEPKLCILHPPN